MEPPRKITNELIRAAIFCDHKITHLVNRQAATETEYFRIQKTITDLHRTACIRSMESSHTLFRGMTTGNYREIPIGKETICAIDFAATNEIAQITFDAVLLSRPSRERIVLEPVFFSLKSKMDATERKLIAVQSLLLQEFFGLHVKTAKTLLLNKSQSVSQKISARTSELKIIEKLRSALLPEKRETYPNPVAHCRECPFESDCQADMKARDDINLLSGLRRNEVKEHQARGIFTVTQLSHAYRPRRRPEDAKPKFYAGLRAMAIRENKIYVTQAPMVQSENTDVFLDVEGLPETDFYYLIGVRIQTTKSTKEFSFWAETEGEERKIWFELLGLLAPLKCYTLFHYGNYEKVFFDKMRRRYRLAPAESAVFDVARKRLVNAVSLIYGRIYFPTYSNGLKDIGKYLGISWSPSQASGALCTAWRTAWELTQNHDFRAQIVSYNAVDCLALARVVDVVRKISKSGLHPASIDGKPVSQASDIRLRSHYRWGNTTFLLPELDVINKCAYFDYQSTKIHFGKRPRKAARRRKLYGKRTFKPNRTVEFSPHKTCPKCGGLTYRHGRNYTKILRDLKFTDGGVKRWVIKSRGLRRRCRKCKYTYLPSRYLRQKHGYGHSLNAFVGYLNIALRMSFGEIQEYFRRVFGMNITPSTLSRMKQALAKYYEPTTRSLMQGIGSGRLLQVDETNAKIDGKGCYVWVFATLSEVVYLFAETRKGDILQTHLKAFRGILISDFFAAYDSMPCEQQKCLIHLIRDLNDDLFTNQLNGELKGFIQDFAVLMKGIVATIDKRGLRARYLSKHKKEVRKFFRDIKKAEYKTEIVQQYQKRFLKNEQRLFTFLKYDNVPWNNNYAENAIKTFAEFRRKFNAHFQKDGLKEYLILLSILHTCKLRRIDFLQFLLSRKRTLPEPE